MDEYEEEAVHLSSRREKTGRTTKQRASVGILPFIFRSEYLSQGQIRIILERRIMFILSSGVFVFG